MAGRPSLNPFQVSLTSRTKGAVDGDDVCHDAHPNAAEWLPSYKSRRAIVGSPLPAIIDANLRVGPVEVSGGRVSRRCARPDLLAARRHLAPNAGRQVVTFAAASYGSDRGGFSTA
jgi:hypothetical protein